MGASRMDPRPRFVLFSVESLEDRYLLSTLNHFHPSPATLSSQPGQSRQLAASASTSQQTTSTQERTGYAPASQPGSSSNATQVTPAAQVASVHPALDLDGPGSDRDDAPGTRDGGDYFLDQQEAIGQYLSGSAGVTGLSRGDAAETAETSAPTGVLQLSFDKLLPTGLSAGLAGAVTVLRVPALSQETGVLLVPSQGEEETSPPAADVQLLPALPLAAADNPAPAPAPVLAPGAPISDALPIDVEAIQRRVDSFFEQLAGLSEEWSDGQLLEKLTPWCMAATVVAWEWARWRRKRSCSWEDAENNGGPEAAAFLTGEGT